MSKTEINEIEVNGVAYVKKGNDNAPAPQVDGLDYVIIRCNGAGVFAGYLKERDGDEATVIKARRLWYWSGAASLSQLAVDGTSKPGDCKFPTEVPMVILTNVLEIIPATEKAQKSIESVKVWQV